MTEKPSIAASSALHWVDFGDDDACSHAANAHGNSFAAPAVAGHDHSLAGDEDVGRSQDAVDRALTGAVAIVEKVLGICIVDGNDREIQHAVFFHRLVADDASGRFLGRANDVGQELFASGVHRGDHVCAVIDDRGAVCGREPR